MDDLKKKPAAAASVTDIDVGTAADVEAVMKKYDRESNVRIWEGKPKLAVGLILAAFSLFCIYVTLFANFSCMGLIS